MLASRVAASILIAALAGACAAHRAPVTPATLGSRGLELKQNIDQLLSAAGLSSTTWGIAIRSMAHDQPLYELNAGKLLVPASNMKIVTLAVSAFRLGWSYTYETSLVAAGTVESGVLKGDLIVVGNGDPTIDDWEGGATALFRSWAEELKKRGISRIEGRVVGDDNAFEDEALGPGWAWDDLDRSFAAGAGALQFNQNSVQLTIAPAPQAGHPAVVTVRPESAPLRIRNLVTTGTPGTPLLLTSRRQFEDAALELRGSAPAGTPPVVRTASVPNPTLYLANALRNALLQNGIDVTGAAVDIDDLEGQVGRVLPDPPLRADPSAAVLMTHHSPPLSTMAATMMKLSQNLYAETFLKSMARDGGIGTAENGRTAERTLLATWGVQPSDAVIADGSGLSRYNLMTAQALVRVLGRVAADESMREPFMASLPIAGRDGTLSNRMRGTPAEGNARAKTGSLSNIRALSGYVRSADDELLAYSLIANNFGGSADLVERTMDTIVASLAAFRR